KLRIKMFKYLFLGITCVLSVQLHAQQIYKWVDKNGNVTYSRKQPPKGAKQQNIETLRSLGTTSTPAPKQTYRSNSSSPDTYVNHYQGTRHNTYTTPRQPTRSAEEEALRQKIIKEASTPYAGSKNGQLKFETFYAMNSFFLDAKNRKVIESKIAAHGRECCWYQYCVLGRVRALAGYVHYQ
ncbi:MAG: hypothetical protein RLZZ384_1404, partial [Pseudomonadota bacterium]